MYALIDTNNATHIAIYVPHEGSDKTMPALLAMMENNMVCIQKNYSSITTVEPTMSFILGDKVVEKSYELELIIQPSGDTIGENWVIACPEVFMDYSKDKKKKDDEISKLRTEIGYLKDQVSSLTAQIQELTDSE